MKIAGFTLVEVLVSLCLAALIVSLLSEYQARLWPQIHKLLRFQQISRQLSNESENTFFKAGVLKRAQLVFSRLDH